MNHTIYKKIESYMQKCMNTSDFVHGADHIYRVLTNAIEIADHYKEVQGIDYDVLIAAALLHDIGREEQNSNLELCHALIGSKKAYDFLISINWPESKAKHVSDCILTHRSRRGEVQTTVEARIIFDADKLDSIGAIGTARILMYSAMMGELFYTVTEAGKINEEPSNSERSTFFQEWNLKKEMMKRLNTEYAKKIAEARLKSSEQFYRSLLSEVNNYLERQKTLMGMLLEKH